MEAIELGEVVSEDVPVELLLDRFGEAPIKALLPEEGDKVRYIAESQSIGGDSDDAGRRTHRQGPLAAVDPSGAEASSTF